MDEVDKKIVKILKNNSKTTLQNISEKINLSIAPTARRINQLEENNIIKNYSVNIDENSLGYKSVSYTHLTLPTKRIV